MEWELSALLATSQRTEIWLTQVFVVVFATVSTNFVLMRLVDLAGRVVARTASLWDDALLEASRLPLRLLVWLVGLSLAIDILQGVAETELFGYVPVARRVAFVVIVALFLNRFISFAERNVVDPQRLSKPMDQTTAKAIARLLRVSVIVTAALVVLQTLGYSVSGVLAFGGVGGIAVGFAARDLLANFFGGLMIYLDKPFAVGDWVRSPDREIEGTVEDIGWRLTRIRTFDQRPLYIPNAMFTNIVVENPSRMRNRRIYEKIGIRYQDARRLRAICDDVRAMIVNHPEIDTARTVIVHFNGYGAHHLEIMVYCFTRTTEWVKFHAVKEDVLLRIADIVHRHGAEFALPARTLHIAREAGRLEEGLTPETAGGVTR